jgi:hypothetical protein
LALGEGSKTHLGKTLAELPSQAFEQAGLYVMRSERLYTFAVCQPIGVNRLGPHKHNDWLSFDLCLNGQPIIIDPGTYCYTGNLEMRRMFALIKPHGEAKVLRWESKENRDLLAAEHTGYARLANPVIHRRQFVLDKIKHSLEIEDSFSGQGEHLLEWHLHLEVGLSCRIEHQTVIISNAKPLLEITFPPLIDTIQTLKGWVSKAYNRKEEAKIIYWCCRDILSTASSFTITIAPLWQLNTY